MTENIVELYPRTINTLTFTCIGCSTRFEASFEPDGLEAVVCPACNTKRVVPFVVVAPPPDVDCYICECGGEFFRVLPEGLSQCIKCGDVTEEDFDLDDSPN